jgi:hypothetical protein
VSENLANGVLSLAIVGWAAAFFAISMWWSERRMRIFVHNYTTFGGTPLKKARVFAPPDEEQVLETALDRIEGIANTKVSRQPTPEDAKFTAETLDNGVQWLMAQAREQGSMLTVEQATEEAERMLNAEGTEM